MLTILQSGYVYLLIFEHLFVSVCPAGSDPAGTRRVKRGSFTGLFDSGVHLSYSVYGPTGECTGVMPSTHTVD